MSKLLIFYFFQQKNLKPNIKFFLKPKFCLVNRIPVTCVNYSISSVIIM